MQKNKLLEFYRIITNKPRQAYHKGIDLESRKFEGKVFVDTVSNAHDIQSFFTKVRSSRNGNKSKILVIYPNHLLEIFFKLADFARIRKNKNLRNWADPDDVENMLFLSGYKVTNTKRVFFGTTYLTTAEPINQPTIKKLTSTIIIPAKNEAGNIPKIIKSIPKFGRKQEIIFVEGHSSDGTWKEIQKIVKKYRNVKAYIQKGVGKSDAVRLGFEKATGDILIIYDADMTVSSKDLVKFYNLLASGKAEFANGCRLVYPMEVDAMRTLNKIANMFFGKIFSRIFETRFKDTLCGTKALFRKDFIKYKKDYLKYLETDPFGDFALIFTAVKRRLKIVEVPVRYKERIYGSTNINRFYHGLLLIKMVFRAFLEFKVW